MRHHTARPERHILTAAAIAATLAAAGCTRERADTATAAAAASSAPVRAAAMAVINGEHVPVPAITLGNPATINRIIDEGLHRNQVMDHLHYICEQIGPRLTGSTAAEQANHWTAERFRSFGLSNVHLHKWAEIPVRFDRGPTTGKVIAMAARPNRGRNRAGDDQPPEVEERTLREFELTTLAWTRGTDGPVRGHVVRMPETDEEFEAVKDRLKGAWVLVKPSPLTGRQGIRAAGGSMNDRAIARYALQTGKSLEDLNVRERDREPVEALIPQFRRLKEAGVLGYISSSRDERVWTTAFRPWRELTMETLPDDVEVQVRLSDYDFLNSRLADGEEFQVEFNLGNTLTPGPWPVYNTVAEIPGTEKPDEFVIVSAHLDSWNGPGSQGTTDNGTGSAVTLEAARILMAAGARPKRTIKFILWTGEEQGLLGSKQWVADHEAIWPKISACFVDDGGTNYQGGLKCTDEMVPLLAAATAPANNLFTDSKDGKPLLVNVQGQGDKFPPGGGSDHASFIRVGIPGFFWDEVGRAEYGYGWHTQNDRLDLAIPEYLMQSATCTAITAYNLACADDLLPRIPVADEQPSENRRPDRAPTEAGGSASRPQTP